MDTDSLPPALSLGVFVLAFFYLSLLQHSAGPARASRRSGPSPLFASGTVLQWLRVASLMAIVLSGIALVQSVAAIGWWPVSFLAIGVFAGLLALDRVSGVLATRNPLPAIFQLDLLLRRSNGAAGPYGNGDHDAESNGAESGADENSPWDIEIPAITEEELTSLDDRDREMLRSILKLEVTTVREIMVPRLDMHTVEADAPLEEVVQAIVERGHSRLPVYEETMDRVLGIVYARDVLGALAPRGPERSLRDLVRPAYIIPETKRVDDLLEEFQERHTQIAIVVDEYGGTEGLVTVEDVLEEIVGEIEDEFSRTRESQFVRQSDGAVLVDARVTTEDVEELLGVRIDSPDFDTIGGLVYHSLGRIPHADDVVETDQLRIEVVSILGRRLRRLRIHRVGQPEPEPQL